MDSKHRQIFGNGHVGIIYKTRMSLEGVHTGSPLDTMEELIEYFEMQNSSVDNMNASFVDGLLNPPSGFVSGMKVRGTPLLPPLMTKKRREECLTYRHQAVLKETRLRAHKREKLLAKDQKNSKNGIFGDMKAEISLTNGANFDEGVVRPVSKTSALSPVREPSSLKFGETMTSTVSDLDSLGITSSYMFQSSDSSECQTTIIARDESSHFKQVVRSLKEEKEREQAIQDGQPGSLPSSEADPQSSHGSAVVAEPTVDAKADFEKGENTVDDAASLLSKVNLCVDEHHDDDLVVNGFRGSGSAVSSEKSPTQSVPDDAGINMAARRRRRNESGSSKSSGAYEDDNMSEYRELPVAGQSKVLGKALDVLKDVAKNKELERVNQNNGSFDKSKESVDDDMFVSGDSNLMCTASTDIMQYMKASVGTMSSSVNTLQASRATPLDDDSKTLTNDSFDADTANPTTTPSQQHSNTIQISGVETGESSTDPLPSKSKKQDESIQAGGVSSRRGKQEHLKRYLQQLSSQPNFHSIDQLSASDYGEVIPKTSDASASTDLDQAVVRPFSYNFEISANMSEDDLLRYQASHYEEMRKRLELQQRQQLAQLLYEQQNEQLRLQQELLDQEERLRRAQRRLHEHQALSFDHGILPHQIVARSRTSPLPGQYEDSSEEETSQRSPYVRSDESKSVDSSHYREFELKADRGEVMRHSEPAYLPGQSEIPSPGIPSVVHRKLVSVKVPEKALAPEMKPKFDKISAAVKGYLTRRLLRTEKVQGLIKTIKDTAEFAISFQSETPIKKGIYSIQDVTLQERVIAQLRAALLEIHEIFFEVPLAVRLSIIAQSRQLDEERRLKERENRRSGNFQKNEKRVSAATVKSIERKKKAKAAEESFMAHVRATNNNQARPKTAPSDPKKLKTLDIRALKPIQGQTSPAKPVKEDMQKPISAERPRTAPSKPSVRDISSKTKRTDVVPGTKKSGLTRQTSQSSKTKPSHNASKVTSANNKLRR